MLANFTEPNSVIVASGTLGEGFEQADWICLVDGCYEIIVGGGTASRLLVLPRGLPSRARHLAPASLPTFQLSAESCRMTLARSLSTTSRGSRHKTQNKRNESLGWGYLYVHISHGWRGPA